jgi:hypothetical protein
MMWRSVWWRCANLAMPLNGTYPHLPSVRLLDIRQTHCVQYP